MLSTGWWDKHSGGK